MSRTTRDVTRVVARLGMVVFAVVVVAGCGDDDDEQPSDTTTTGLANPASEFCVSQGGEVGYCDLPDGTRVEEWEYFRSQTGTTTAL